jgi:hypothetical protein
MLGITHPVSSADRGTEPPQGGRRGRRIARKLAKWAALLLAGGALLYLAGMNVFLRTRLFRNAISGDPDTLLVDYTTAYSWWPGLIHVEGLSIRGRDSHVEWILRLDRCIVRVNLSELAHKKFHADHVRADGVSMRVRLRADAVAPERMAALPPVPGFSDPPLKDVGPEPPPLTDANYNLWSIELDDVVADHVREVWIDTLRFSGDLEIHGRWLFRPIRWLEVGPAVLDVRALEVGYGMIEPWASGVVGRLAVTIHPLNLETMQGGDLIDHLSIEGDLNGTARLANALDRAMEGKGLQVDRADAPLELHAHLDHGVLGPGTHLHSAAFDSRARAGGLTFETSLQADLHVDDENVGYADLRVEKAQVSAEGRPRGRAAAIAAALSSRQLDLAHPFADTTYSVDVDAAWTDSLSYWRSRLAPASEVEIASGTLTASGHVAGSISEETGSGHISLSARGLLAAQADTGFQGDVDGNVELGRVDLERHQLAGAVRLTADRMSLRFRGMTFQTDLQAHAVVREGRWDPWRFDFAPSEASLRKMSGILRGVTVVVPSVEVRSDDLALGEAGVAGRVTVDTPRIEVPSLPALAALLSLPPDVALESGRGSASVRLDVDLARLACHGGAQIAARDLRLRVGSARMVGDLTVALQATQSGGITDLSGSQVDFKSTGAPDTLDWWGRVRLREATVQIRPAVRVRTQLAAEAKDASPLTALVASNTAIPQWVMNAVSTKQFEVTGEVLVTPSVFAVRSVQAHAEGAEVGFELSKIREDKDWALLLDVGAVVAGVDVANGKTQVLFFGARPWFQQKAAWLQAAEQRSE